MYGICLFSPSSLARIYWESLHLVHLGVEPLQSLLDHIKRILLQKETSSQTNGTCPAPHRPAVCTTASSSPSLGTCPCTCLQACVHKPACTQFYTHTEIQVHNAHTGAASTIAPADLTSHSHPYTPVSMPQDYGLVCTRVNANSPWARFALCTRIGQWAEGQTDGRTAKQVHAHRDGRTDRQR